MVTRSDSWTRVISAVRAQARRSYMRKLHLAQRQNPPLRKTVVPGASSPLESHRRPQINGNSNVVHLEGIHFQSPNNNSATSKMGRRMGPPHVETKCKALLYKRLQVNGAKRGTVMTGLMRKWAIEGSISNPPTAHALPPAFNYLQQYALDMAYVPPQCASEARKSYKRRIYDTLHHMYTNGATSSDIPIVKKYPNAARGRV